MSRTLDRGFLSPMPVTSTAKTSRQGRAERITPCRLLRAAVFALMAPVAVNAAGPDYIRDEQPVVDTMDDAKGTFEEGFEGKRFARSLYPRLKRRLESLSPFWRDTSLAIKPRSYYLDSRRDSPDSVAWAAGGSVEHLSGWWKERLRIPGTTLCP